MYSMLTFPNRKHIRAKVIAQYIQAAGYAGVVVFSCGNSAAALRDQGLDVLEIGPKGPLSPARWWHPAEIHRVWPDRFDATSGHLPLPLMLDVGRAFMLALGDLDPSLVYQVPTGSGETIMALRWVYPLCTFMPLYDVGPGTQYEDQAPLNGLVAQGLCR